MANGTTIASCILSLAAIALVVWVFSTTEGEIEGESLLFLAKVFAVWLFVPFVNFIEYLRLPVESLHEKKGIRKRKYVLLALTVGLAALCAADLIGELSPGPDIGPTAVILLFWLLPPLCNVFLGLRTSDGKSIRMSLVIAAYYFSWILPCALNGNTRDREGDGHMYVIFAPIVMTMLCPFVMYAEFCGRRIAAWLRS